MERVAALDLLRGLAALAVAIPHYIMLSGSTAAAPEIVSVLAVEVFFVLSGFVLGPQILRCLHTGRAGDLGIFLVRRWMRTIPPYLFAMALIAAIAGHVSLANLARYAFYVENLTSLRIADDFFPVAWSLSIEEWFYIAFPGLLLIASRVMRGNGDRFAVIVALCFIGAITTLRLAFGDLDDWGPNVRRVVVFRIDSIAYGFLLFMFVRHGASGTSRSWQALLRLPAAAVLFLATAAIAGVLTWRIGAVQSHLAETLYPFAAAAFGMAAILMAYAAGSVFQRSALAQFCYFLGRVSYSLYLFHFSVALTITPLLAGLPMTVRLLLYLGICVGLSAVFYRVFERPILAARPGYRRSAETQAIEGLGLAAGAGPAA